MSFLPDARDAIVHIQDSSLTAVSGDQNNHNNAGGSTTITGPQHFAGDQNIYQAAPLTGTALPLFLLSFLTNSVGKDLLHRHTSPAALLDSRARRDPPRCMEGTREAIIQEILDWLKKVTKSSSILWLRGPAGHGKTALEFTIAEICKREGLLIGSFFFSNRIANCSDGTLLFTTLAAQLMQAFPSTARYIDKAIRHDPHIFDKALETQMKALIVEPIKRISTMVRVIDTVTFGLKSYPTLIVIDGLDECVGIDVQDEIIRIIGDLVQNLRLPLRFLIASRPEPNLCEAFEKLQSQLPKDSLSTLVLTEDALTRRDIQIYLERKFKELRARHSYLPVEWPGPDIILRLVDKASGQFVYATTIIIYISSPDDRPDDRLNIILKLLETPVGDTPYAPLDQLYSHIVHAVKHRTQVLQILGQLILAKEMPNEQDILGSPSNSTATSRIEVILGLRDGDARRLLNRMHSLIDVGDDLKLLHASFPDFLQDTSRSMGFVVNLAEAREMLGLAYIRAICNPSRMCFFFTALGLGSDLMSLVAIFFGSEQARTSKPDVSLMASAIQYCTAFGLSERLSNELRTTNIIASYELYVRAAPWKRHPATLVLNEISNLLIVRIFHS